MKKIFISLLSVMMIFTMAFSTNAFAETIYTIDNLPCELQKVPQQEQELSSEIKEEILYKLLETEYPDCAPEDIVIKYYGKLSNGALLINHYNKTYTYPELTWTYKDACVAKYANIDFMYRYETEKDCVSLYMYDEFYTFEDAYKLGLTDINVMFELVNVVDHFYFYLSSYWDDTTSVVGDVNGDGVLTILDATLIQKKIIGAVSFNESETESADINGDGIINVSDVTQIQKLAIGIN